MSRPRTVEQFIRDTTISKCAQRDYMQAAVEIDELAEQMRAVGDERRQREFSHLAFIARNAARAEFFDPDPSR